MNACEANHCWPIGIRVLPLLALVSSATATTFADRQSLSLVADGESKYAIVLSADASPSEKWAAEDLVSHLRQMSGATLDVQAEGESLPAKAILIGDGQTVRSLGVKLDTAALGPDGFVIRTVGDRLVDVWRVHFAGKTRLPVVVPRREHDSAREDDPHRGHGRATRTRAGVSRHALR